MLKHTYIWFLGVLSGLIILVGHHYNYMPLHWILYVMFTGFVLTVWGAFDIRLGYFTEVYYKATTNEKIIALTFDDGPHPVTHQVLDLLQKYNMKATFFCIGKEIEKYPEIVIRIHKEGHTIGNHTFTHTTKMGFLPSRKIKQEIGSTDAVIYELINKRPLLFRPPFGVTNPSIAKAAKRLKKAVIGWNIRSLDTVLTQEHTILNRVLSRLKPGAIILFHDTSERTGKTLEQLLLYMSHNKYTSVTVNELLKIEAYEK